MSLTKLQVGETLTFADIKYIETGLNIYVRYATGDKQIIVAQMLRYILEFPQCDLADAYAAVCECPWANCHPVGHGGKPKALNGKVPRHRSSYQRDTL